MPGFGSRTVAPIKAGEGRPDKAFNLYAPGVVPPDIAPPEPAIADEPLVPPTDWNSISPAGPMYPVPEQPTKGRGVGWWLDQLLLGGLGGAMMKANEVPNPNYHGPAGAAAPPVAAAPPAPAPAQEPQAPVSPLPQNLSAPPELTQPLFRRRQRQFKQLGAGPGMVGPR